MLNIVLILLALVFIGSFFRGGSSNLTRSANHREEEDYYACPDCGRRMEESEMLDLDTCPYCGEDNVYRI